MSITPIDIATMAPKSQEAVIAKNAEVQKPMTDQMNASIQVDNKALHDSEQTVPTVKTENPEFRYDARKEGRNFYEQQNQKRKKTKNKNEKISEKKTNSIDIRI